MTPNFKASALAAACAAILSLGLSTSSAAPQAPADSARATAATECSDFDHFVNGDWVATTELPPDRARVGSFDTLRRANDRLLEAGLAELAADPARQATPGLKLLAAYYRSGVDLPGIAERGLAPVAPLLARIDALTRDQLPALLGELNRLQIHAPLALQVGVDARNATRHVLNIGQSGLGLPDRDDYARSDAGARKLEAAYRVYAKQLLGAAAAPADDASIDALMGFETELAKASMTRVQRRDPIAVYNPVTSAGLNDRAGGFDWPAWLAAYGAPADAPVVLGQPLFATAVAELAREAPIATWQTYLRVRLLDATATHLPLALAQANFDYHGATIRGLKARPPRAEELIVAIGGRYGQSPLAETLGELFVAKAFSPLAQQRAQQMVDDIKAALHDRIETLPWMSPPTRVLAQAKLDAMVAKIGAPAAWRRYDGLQLAADDHAGNLLAVSGWATAQRLADLGRPVDRERWHTSPHIVNAFAGGGNQIVFPAGILRPPFFDAGADDASNYGAIGMVIGHEITHHFDDRGRQFDAVGNLRDWWSAADVAAYRERADAVAALYSGFEALPGVHIDGRLTLGENISDMAGIQIAYDGLQRALARQRSEGRTIPLVDGRTPEQRFFVANALMWRGKTRPEALLDQLRTDGHSPNRWRVLAPMAHAAPFAQAFGCSAGDPMVATPPIRVW